jgi:hypothetical protein
MPPDDQSNPQDGVSDKVIIKETKPTALHWILRAFGMVGDGRIIELNSNKQPSKIIASLNYTIGASANALHESKPADYKCAGYAIGKSFQLFFCARAMNTWRPILYGTVEETEHGSRIIAHFDVHPIAKILMPAFAGTVVWAALSTEYLNAPMLFFLALFTFLLPQCCMALAEGEKEQLLALLKSLA